MSTDNLIIFLLIIVIVLIIVFIGVLLFIGLRFIKLQESKKTSHQSDIAKPIDLDLDNHSQNTSRSICIDHPEELSLNICSISEQPYCEKCIIKHDETWVAKKHLDILVNSKWQEILNFEQTNNVVEVEKIKSIKLKLWENHSIPILIQGNYKIDVEDDQIHSFMVIKARMQDLEIVQKELSFVKIMR